jgi:FKBP-type peptidyl-prolyl cis-trans isomerase FkpA/FKBP-type peptidyl-prolyl cis-trans isomerase FklB
VLAAEAPTQKPAAAPKPAANPAAAAAKPDDSNKAFYALGVLLAGNLKTFALSDAELEQVKAGLADGVHGKAGAVDPQTFIPKLQELERTRLAAVANKEKEAGKAYLAKAATQPGAKKTASGIVITTVKEGTGASPAATDQVKVHYEGKLINGTVFDSSIKRNEPATFPLNGVIPCWTEAVQTMKVGGKSKVVCPSDLAYGDNGSPPRIGPGATLVFDIELLDIMKAPPAPAAGGLQVPPPK